MSPKWVSDTKEDWPTEHSWHNIFDFFARRQQKPVGHTVYSITLHWIARLIEQASAQSTKSQRSSWWQCCQPTLRAVALPLLAPATSHDTSFTSPAAHLPQKLTSGIATWTWLSCRIPAWTPIWNVNPTLLLMSNKTWLYFVGFTNESNKSSCKKWPIHTSKKLEFLERLDLVWPRPALL